MQSAVIIYLKLQQMKAKSKEKRCILTLFHGFVCKINPNIFAYYIFYSYFCAVKQRGAYMAEIIPYEPEPGNAGVGIVHTATLCLGWLSPQLIYLFITCARSALCRKDFADL